jgi:hypothetical protein
MKSGAICEQAYKEVDFFIGGPPSTKRRSALCGQFAKSCPYYYSGHPDWQMGRRSPGCVAEDFGALWKEQGLEVEEWIKVLP